MGHACENKKHVHAKKGGHHEATTKIQTRLSPGDPQKRENPEL
jgi:hypothetical protein